MRFLLLPVLLLAAGTSHAALPAGDPVKGKEVYEDYCGACHSVDQNRVGPAHQGVYGRRPGLAPGYSYSPGMKKARFVWNAQTLDKWLQGPSAVVPGTKMGFSLSDPQKRADVIAYLKSISPAKK